MRKHYSPQFKTEAVLELLREEKTVAEIAAERHVHPTMLHRWRKLALEALPKVFAHEDGSIQERANYDKKIHELYAEIGRLSTQLEWLGKKGVRFE
jgi:transposase-like protein